MGQQISHALVAAAEDFEPLGSNLESLKNLLGMQLEYERSLGSSRFMKTICYKQENEGRLVVKTFKIPDNNNIDIKRYILQIEKLHRALEKVDGTLSYAKVFELDGNVYLTRQYLKYNLYDRLSTRQFLTTEDKIWITFQLLYAASEMHKRGIFHGDIKMENIILTSWNWVYITDHAPFKPILLPEDDPAEFSFFFDLSLRRACYLAPERFVEKSHKSDILNSNNLDILFKMDIFSLGCVIAELFLEDSPLFTLSQLLKYRNGVYDPMEKLSKINNPNIINLVKHMTQINESSRLSASNYLEIWRDTLFPSYFCEKLYGIISRFSSIKLNSVTDAPDLDEQYVEIPGLSESIVAINESLWVDKLEGERYNNTCDSRISQIMLEWDMVSDVFGWHKLGKAPLSLEKRESKYFTAARVFIWFISSNVKYSSFPTSRRRGILLLQHLSYYVDSETIMGFLVPNVASMLKDTSSHVNAAAINCLSQMINQVDSVQIIDINLFEDYLMFYINQLCAEGDDIVLIAIAKSIPIFAEAAERFYRCLVTSTTKQTPDTLKHKNTLTSISDMFIELTKSILMTSSDEAKRTLLLHINSLLFFFMRTSLPGNENSAIDVIMAHIMTFLNSKSSWQLRVQFFEAIVYIAASSGKYTVEQYIIPLIVSAVEDPEDFVIVSCLNLLERLGEMGLLGYREWNLISSKIGPLTFHPNLLISNKSKDILIFILRSQTLDKVQKSYITNIILAKYFCYIPNETSQTALKNAFFPQVPKRLFYSQESHNHSYDNDASNYNDVEIQNPFVASNDNSSKILKMQLESLRNYIDIRKNNSEKNKTNILPGINSSADFGLTLHTVFLSPAKRFTKSTEDHKNVNTQHTQLKSAKSNSSYQSGSLNRVAGEDNKHFSTDFIPGTSNSDALIGKHVHIPINKNLGKKNGSKRVDNIWIGSPHLDGYGKRINFSGTPTIGMSHDTAEAVFMPPKTSTYSDSQADRVSNVFSSKESSINRQMNDPQIKDLETFEHQPSKKYDGGIESYMGHHSSKDKPLFAHEWIKLGKSSSEFMLSLNQVGDNISSQFQGTLVASLFEHNLAITSISSNSEFKTRSTVNSFADLFITGSNDGTVKAWSMKTLLNGVFHKSITTFYIGGRVTATAFISEKKVICCSDNGSIRTIEIHEKAFRNPNIFGISGGASISANCICSMDLEYGEYIIDVKRCKESEGTSGSVAVTSHSRLLFLDNNDLKIKWELKIPLETGMVSCLEVKDVLFAVVGTIGSSVYLVDLRFQIILGKYHNPSGSSIVSIKLTGNDKQVLVGTSVGDVYVLDLSLGTWPSSFVNESWNSFKRTFEENDKHLDNRYNPVISLSYIPGSSLGEDQFLATFRSGLPHLWETSSFSCACLSLNKPDWSQTSLLVSSHIYNQTYFHCVESEPGAKSGMFSDRGSLITFEKDFEENFSGMNISGKLQSFGNGGESTFRKGSLSVYKNNQNEAKGSRMKKTESFSKTDDKRGGMYPVIQTSYSDEYDIVTQATVILVKHGVYVLVLGYKNGNVKVYF
ncbi:hypothetical protein BB558_004076 [Smittium angustum]|uniref:non-specific serine/threonine protein kinase n=1 Tax=Smittium angustum TaxID=133377 RepID=A0A2U1J479_SMIAN|nr:hypothetical protein BB558_004076 [Smittium angustum]